MGNILEYAGQALIEKIKAEEKPKQSQKQSPEKKISTENKKSEIKIESPITESEEEISKKDYSPIIDVSDFMAIKPPKKKGTTIGVYLTDEEYDLLIKLSDKHGISKSNYLKILLINSKNFDMLDSRIVRPKRKKQRKGIMEEEKKKEKKRTVVGMYLTDEECSLLEEMSDKYGISMSNYMRTLLINSK